MQDSTAEVPEWLFNTLSTWVIKYPRGFGICIWILYWRGCFSFRDLHYCTEMVKTTVHRMNTSPLTLTGFNVDVTALRLLLYSIMCYCRYCRKKGVTCYWGGIRAKFKYSSSSLFWRPDFLLEWLSFLLTSLLLSMHNLQGRVLRLCSFRLDHLLQGKPTG